MSRARALAGRRLAVSREAAQSLGSLARSLEAEGAGLLLFAGGPGRGAETYRARSEALALELIGSPRHGR